MKPTKKLTPQQYASPFFLPSRKEEIQQLINRESECIITVGKVEGIAGRAIPEVCEVQLKRGR